MRISNDSADYTVLGTHHTDGSSNSRIVLSGGTRSTDTGDIHYRATSASGDHRFYTNETDERLTIRNDGNVGIGNTNPGNILQVGTGERLRISNGNSDFTRIGTSDTIGVNNTCITISGSSRSTFTGNITYEAVNNHMFYTTSTGSYIERFRIKNDGNVGIGTDNPAERLTVVGNISLSSGTYRNGGFSIAFSGKFRNGVGFINGYFIDPVDYNNSLMICAFSHDSISYQVWNGRISVNKNNAVTDVTNFYAPNSMIVDAFIEATTLKSWIYINPVAAYNSSTNLFAKIYG